MVTVLIFLLYLVLIVALILVLAVQLPRSNLSHFELLRRVKLAQPQARAIELRERALQDIASLQHVLASVLLVVVVLLGIGQFGWGLGTVIALLIALEAGALAGLRPFRTIARKLYRKIESSLLLFVIEAHWLRFLRRPMILRKEQILESKEELVHLITTAHEATLSEQLKQELNGVLEFDLLQVHQYMTPVQQVVSVEKKELLGPLVLDDLHKTGHSYFPVIDGGINQVVGILSIESLLTVDGRQRSVTAEKAMEPHVFFIHKNQRLAELLGAVLDMHHQLFIVLNDEQVTVGLISLRDVLMALRGHDEPRIVASYEDPRSIAARDVEEERDEP